MIRSSRKARAMARARKTFGAGYNGGRPRKLFPCPKCGRNLSARERRKRCPAH